MSVHSLLNAYRSETIPVHGIPLIGALSLGHLTGSENLLERVLVQHGHAKLLGLGELGARLGAGNQIARLL